MIKFIPANQLKKELDVFGHFYSIKININKVTELFKDFIY